MNYLAHLFLAGDHPHNIGGLLGDFAKGDVWQQYPQELALEIMLHRKIDSYTDSHLIVKQAKLRFPPPKRKYAGIVLDVFYDHVLALNWADYHQQPLTDFSQQVYANLLSQHAILPDKLQFALPIMIEEDWLSNYASFEHIKMTIQRIAKRLKRENLLADCLPELEQHYDLFVTDFKIFFPELMEFVKRQRQGFIIKSHL